MKRRTYAIIAAIILICFAFGLAAWSYFSVKPSSDPIYGDHHATYWLRQILVPANQREALAAFREMGSDADPVLIAAFKKPAAWWYRAYARCYVHLPGFARDKLPLPQDFRNAAALAILNRQCEISVPLEDAILDNLRDEGGRAGLDLLVSPKAAKRPASAVPQLKQLMADGNPRTALTASLAYLQLTRETNRVVPLLKNFSSSPDFYIQYWSSIYLLNVHQPPPNLAAVISSGLTNTNYSIRLSASSAAAALPALNRASLAALTMMARGNDPMLNLRAQATLKKFGHPVAGSSVK